MEEAVITKLRRLMDIRGHINNIDPKFRKFYTALSSPAYLNGRWRYTSTIWIVNEQAVREHLAAKAVA